MAENSPFCFMKPPECQVKTEGINGSLTDKKITFKSTAVHERICDETSQNHIANFMLVYMFVLAVRLTETSP